MKRYLKQLNRLDYVLYCEYEEMTSMVERRIDILPLKVKVTDATDKLHEVEIFSVSQEIGLIYLEHGKECSIFFKDLSTAHKAAFLNAFHIGICEEANRVFNLINTDWTQEQKLCVLLEKMCGEDEEAYMHLDWGGNGSIATLKEYAYDIIDFVLNVEPSTLNSICEGINCTMREGFNEVEMASRRDFN